MIHFRCSDEHRLKVNCWLPAEREATGVVLIVHGVGEYSARYAPLGTALAGRGLAVYGPDLRGHGGTAADNDAPFGHLADRDGWERTVEDLHELVLHLKRSYPELPLYVFGHSMGSLLSRRLIQKHGALLDGVIHSAASAPMGMLASIGLLLAKLEIRLIGGRSMSKRMGFLLFGGFNRAFRPNRTPHDWISSVDAEVDRYMADTHILKFFSAALYRDMIGGVIALNRAANMKGTPTELPQLFISGMRDPLGDFGAGVERTAALYRNLGCGDITVKLYADARHELLQEYCREQVIEDIYAWLSRLLKLPH